MAIQAPSLLITDDDVAFRETLQEVFAPKGFRTLLASNGEEALQIIQTRVVHIALFDMHMPRLTGLETLRLVKRVKAILPCILLSANLDEQTVELARRADAFSVLHKPVTTSQIIGIVHSALQLTYNWHTTSE
jgi:CheY-like chemotaxis protein